MGIPYPRTSHLERFAGQKKSCVLEGTLLSPVEVYGDMGKLNLMAERLIMGKSSYNVNEKIRVTVYSHVPDMEVGDRIRFPAILRAFENFKNPGSFDYRSYMTYLGFSCSAAISDGRYIVPMGKGTLPFFVRLTQWFKQPIRDFFFDNVDDKNRPLLLALILGERQGITPQTREIFSKTGLGHVLAVSGLHIGLVCWFSFFLLKRLLCLYPPLMLRFDIRKAAAGLTCIPLVLYVALSGFQISAIRAMIMAMAFLWSIIVGRQRDIWSTLCLAGVVILAFDPRGLFQISFQLSFIAVIGLIWVYPIADKGVTNLLNSTRVKISPPGHRIIRYMVGLLLVTVIATIFLLPITSKYFHRISFVGILANLLVVPVLGLWVLPLGLTSAFFLFISGGLAKGLVTLACYGISLVATTAQWLSQRTWASMWIFSPSLFEVAIFYAFIFFVYFFRASKWAKIGLVCLLMVAGGDSLYWIMQVKFNRDLRVTYIDVGQGSSVLVEFPQGKKMLIDGGGFARDQFDVGRQVVAPLLWQKKIYKIDYLVLTHPQADHMNGLRFIARVFHPTEFWYNGDQSPDASFHELKRIIEKQNIRQILPELMSEPRNISNAIVELLHPVAHNSTTLNSRVGTSSLNNNSLVIKITYGKLSFLFPGDLEKSGERILVGRWGSKLKSTVLLSPHHGSRTSSSEIFLKAVGPKICVISCRGTGHFAFPHREVLKRLQRLGVKIYRTDIHGAIECKTSGQDLKIYTFVSR